MRFSTEASSLMLFGLLVVAESSGKINHTMSEQSKANNRSAQAVKKANWNSNVDIDGKSRFAQNPRDKIYRVARQGHFASPNAVREQQRIFQDERRSNIENKKLRVRNKWKSRKGIAAKTRQGSKIELQSGKAKSEIIYKTPDGLEHLTVDNKKQDVQAIQAVIRQGAQVNPFIPSKSFLVTVYGDQIEGAAERLRAAVTQQEPKKCESTPCPQTGGQRLMLFPNAGRPFGTNGCICPCCVCSCSQPGYENYNCGCQNRPPQPCPCSPATNTDMKPLPTSSVVSSGNQVTPWSAGTSSCSCPCCPCTCAQTQMYPYYQCGCASQPPTPCPCSNQGLYFDQSGAENNVARSQENNPYPPTTNYNAPGYSPYPSTFNNDVSGYPVSYPTTNAPLVHRYQAGDFTFDNTCDCYCCPCSCPGNEYVAYDSSHCTCGLDRPCLCRRSDVKTGHH